MKPELRKSAILPTLVILAAWLVPVTALWTSTRELRQRVIAEEDLRKILQANYEAEFARLNGQGEALERSRAEVRELRRKLSRQQGELAGPTDLYDSGKDPQLEQALLDLKRRATDETNDPSDRLAALRELRSLDARDGEVVQSMIRLMSTVDAKTRADILRNLEGVTDPQLKEPLLQALSEEHAEVRAEAVEALAYYAQDPVAKSWLQHLARFDSAEPVRYEAVNSLYLSAGLEELQLMATDPNASELERLFAILHWKEQSGPSAQTARALVELYASATDGEIRAEAMESLRRHHTDIPNVKAWLRFARENDSHPAVLDEVGDD